MCVIYSGERVRLRPFADGDEFARLKLAANREPNVHWGPLHIAERTYGRQFAAAGLLDPQVYCEFAVERLDTGELVGREEWGPVKPGAISTTIGTEILPAHQHQGFGIEAKLLALSFLFESYPIQTVGATTVSTHVRAQQGLVACGMRLIGTLRRVLIKDGRYAHLLKYCIFRDEWEQLPIRRIVKRGA